MKDKETPYTPYGFHFETETDVQAQEARDTHIAYEFRADFRKGEGSEREYISDDPRSTQVHHITDGLTEALAIGLSNQWIKEEEDSHYSHLVKQMCPWCRLACGVKGCQDCAPNVDINRSEYERYLPSKVLSYFDEIMSSMYV